MIGRGEGLDQAADYLNTKPHVRKLKVFSWYDEGSFYIFSTVIHSHWMGLPRLYIKKGRLRRAVLPATAKAAAKPECSGIFPKPDARAGYLNRWFRLCLDLQNTEGWSAGRSITRFLLRPDIEVTAYLML